MVIALNGTWVYGQDAVGLDPRCFQAPTCLHGLAPPYGGCHGVGPGRMPVGRLSPGCGGLLSGCAKQVASRGRQADWDQGAALLAAIQAGQAAYQKDLPRADRLAAVYGAGIKIAGTTEWRGSSMSELAVEVVFESRLRDLGPLFFRST